MKKYACLILFALLLNGCDDGDLTVDDINFEDIKTVQSCNTETNSLLYKLKTQEALLLQLPEGTIKNDATKEGEPIIYDIPTGGNGTYRVLYRAYNGTVATENICGTIPPKTPNVTEEWLAIGGKIVIISTQKTTTDEVTKATKIIGYSHNINFENITFSKPSGIDQIQAKFPFGTFDTTVANPIVVQFTDQTAKYCKENKKIYNDNGTAALVIKNLDNELIGKETNGVPRTAIINTTSTTNNVSYEIYGTTLPVDPSTYFCTNVTPQSPTITETWVGQTGDATKMTGIIEVTTTSEEKVYRHTVVLKGATLQKGNSSFYLGTTFLVGTFVTLK